MEFYFFFCACHIFCGNFPKEHSWSVKIVFATNSNFLNPISLQSDGLNHWYIKHRLFDLTDFIVWNIKGLRHQVAKMYLKKVRVSWTSPLKTRKRPPDKWATEVMDLLQK